MFMIQDWAGNRMWADRTWDTFEDAWSFIYERVPDEDHWQEYEVVAIPQASRPLTENNKELLLELESESTVMLSLLVGNADLVAMVKAGKSKQECLNFINENW